MSRVCDICSQPCQDGESVSLTAWWGKSLMYEGFSFGQDCWDVKLLTEMEGLVADGKRKLCGTLPDEFYPVQPNYTQRLLV